ncbi:MAG: hypothetical protein ACTSVV_06545 [Promethearchaeota archaeon]
MTTQISAFELNFFLALTIILISVKLLLSIYLGKRIYYSKKETGQFSLNFITAFFVLIVSLLISRLFYLYFDFFLTKLDHTTYHLMPNVLIWKIGGVISASGFAFVLYVLDKKALKFKLKGIFVYIIIIGEIIVLAYPVKTAEDFTFVSELGIITGVGAFLVLFIFLYIGIKIPGLRKPSFLMLSGLVIYAIGGILVNEFVVSLFVAIYGYDIRFLLYLLFIILKIIGLIIIAFSVTKFSI